MPLHKPLQKSGWVKGEIALPDTFWLEEACLPFPWMFSAAVLVSNFIIVIDIFVVSMLYII
jgi:hypothetical protein